MESSRKNFVGAERDKRELLRGESSRGILDFSTSQKIKWSFTPEHVPHFSGLWVGAVKAFKDRFKKLLVTPD